MHFLNCGSLFVIRLQIWFKQLQKNEVMSNLGENSGNNISNEEFIQNNINEVPDVSGACITKINEKKKKCHRVPISIMPNLVLKAI